MTEIIGEENKAGKPSDLQKTLLMVLGLVILIILGLGWYIFDVMNNKLEQLESLSQLSAQKEGKDVAVDLAEKKEGTLNLSNTDPLVGGIVEKVSKHILLPAGEITVATINDADALRQQYGGVFKYAKNGDRLLMSAESIIIYDQTIDKVVDVVR